MPKANRIGPAVEPIEPEMDPASTVSAPGDDESDLEDGDSAASVSEDGDFEDDGEFDEFDDEDGTEQDGAEQEQEQAAYLTILDGETPAGGDDGEVGSTHPGGDGAPQTGTVPYHPPGGIAVATLEAPASVMPPMPQQPYSRAGGSSGGASTVDFPAGQDHITSAQEPQLRQPESEISAIADLESLNSTSHPHPRQQQQQQQQRTTGGRKISRGGAGRHTSTVSPEKREALAALLPHPDKPRHSKTSFATMGMSKNFRHKVNAAGHGIYDMLHKHFGSKEDHEVLKKFPWDNSVHEAVGNPKTLITKSKFYWRRQFNMFVRQLDLIDGLEFYCPLGYALSLATTDKVADFVDEIKCFFARLRSFDQIDGRIDPVKHSEMYTDDKDKPIDAATDWPPHPEELIKLFYSGDEKKNKMKEESKREEREKHGKNPNRHQHEATALINDFDPRALLDQWSKTLRLLFQSWSETDWVSDEKNGCEQVNSANPVNRLNAYIDQVDRFVKWCYATARSSLSQVFEASSGGEGGFMEKQLEAHVAMLCAIFNFGGCVRLAVSAEQPQITRELLQLYDCFKQLTSLYHEGEWRRRLLGPIDGPGSLVQDVMYHNPPIFAGMFQKDRQVPPQRIRVKCYNCIDPQSTAGDTKQGNECKRCSGPRCTDKIEHGKGLDWTFSDKANKEAGYIYFDKFWGWEWPMHPVHSRSPSGRNALHCAVQAGHMDCVELLLAENADLLAVTFGGDTTLHYAARFDNDQVLFRIILALLQPQITRDLSEYHAPSTSGRLPEWAESAPEWVKEAPKGTREIYPTPLHEVSTMLRSCENKLAKLADPEAEEVHDLSGDTEQPMCPCRCMDPVGNVWDWEENDHKTKHRQRRYGRCHGLIAREDANSGDLLMLPMDEGTSSEDLPTMTSDECVRELPRVLERLKSEHDQMETMIDTNCSLLTALAVFRDMRNEAGRTALHAAAFMDRDTSCKALLALGSDPAVRDRFSVSALQLMVSNIPQSANTALSRYHRVDKSARMQYFYLLKLETSDPREATVRDQHCRQLIRPAVDNSNPKPRTILQELVLNDRRSLINHDVVKQLLKYKWESFGKWYHYSESLKYLVYLVLWSLVALRQPFERCTALEGTVTANCTADTLYGIRNDYRAIVVHADTSIAEYATLGGGDRHWNSTFYGSGMEIAGLGIVWMVVETMAFLWSLYYMYQEYAEVTLRSSVATFHRTFSLQALDHISIGITDRCSLSANDYEHQITLAVEEITGGGGSQYFADTSNYLDIVMLICLPTSFVLQRVSQFVADDQIVLVAQSSAGLLAIGLFVAWFNLLKFLRAFSGFGPLYVVMMKMRTDVGNFGILYITFSIPITLIFQMFYGKDSAASDSFTNFGRSWMSSFQLMMVDFDSSLIQTSNYTTGSILYLCWVFISAIVMLNLFIAMMSATFQNAYDAKEDIWALERANIISRAEEYMSKSLLEASYYTFSDMDINTRGADDSQPLARFIKTTREQVSDNVDNSVKVSKRLTGQLTERHDGLLYHHTRHDNERIEHARTSTAMLHKTPWYQNLGQMTADFKNPTGSSLEEYLEEEYDDPDEEPEIDASVRAKLLAVVTRLEGQQETLNSKIEKMAAAMNRRDKAALSSANARGNAQSRSRSPAQPRGQWQPPSSEAR